MTSTRFDRLFVVQGCASLLNALCFIVADSRENPRATYRDGLILAWAGTEESNERKVREACLKIASLGSFSAIYSISNLERLVLNGGLNFEEAVTRFRAGLKTTSVGRIFLIRNYQLVNEIAAHAFASTPLTCLGDFFGSHDSDPAEIAKFSSKPLPVPDSLAAVFPIETRPGLFNRYPLKLIPVDVFVTLVRHASALFAKEVWRVAPRREGNGGAIVLLSYESDGGYAKSLAHEIESYVEQVRRFVGVDTTLFIKSHPREVNGQEAAVAAKLVAAGYRCVSLRPLRHLPIELLVAHLGADLLLSLFSTSCVSVGAISPMHIVVGIGQASLEAHISEKWLKIHSAGEVMRVRATKMAQDGYFPPLNYESWISLSAAQYPEPCVPSNFCAPPPFQYQAALKGPALKKIPGDFTARALRLKKRLENWVSGKRSA